MSDTIDIPPGPPRGAVRCVRCGETAPAATGVSWGGALGAEIRAKICGNCWSEWQDAEVKVINELRLNFMDPEAQDVLTAQLREFLTLGGGAATDPAG